MAVGVSDAVLGHVDLFVEALVSDRFVAPSVQTKAAASATADNETVVWEDNYYRDRAACRAEYEEWVKRHVIVEHIPIWRTLPDPPPSDYWRVIRQLGLITELLKQARGESHELVLVAESMMREMYGVTPEIVRQITNQQKRGAHEPVDRA